jgi:uncharacterized alpha-E superfamily protein
VTTLRCCSAYEAYLRTYRRAVDTNLAAEFLLLDRLFPRSVFWALASAERCLLELDPTSSRTGAGDDARRIVGRVRTELEFRPFVELLHALPEYLAHLQDECGAVGAAIAARYFRHTQPVEWSA